ncbi:MULTISPECIES: flagellar type III secretion system pore protein FliP [Clostridium]|jgi:flagellar biosynthesis protein FliP|uniref:flagellar type III secretion system pore protein FliP n=1 Tax=Clostridium TaxID=1485 RepID=UPI00189C277E|nr:MULTISPECIES: flagellar type III secretion system pore protein FliP [Clostridium]MCR1950170.1 flagellar type III secretion system pore protein FliP [Clostridium sp. DSM 100503]MDI9219168.1 flagellar type III secretion system pore protein FliP [Clostridium tertium]MDU1277263.1 flagellar type III secretion system pore protein FliP [Clostridium sp.]MDU7087775.1 flagellar type III secretion system pore protein FliP [Clostridium sp.]MDU7947226.1 flagellar type III secretion system pore protein F
MSKKKKYLFMMLIALTLIFTFDKCVSAEPINVPNVNISVGGESTSPQNYVDNIKLLIILTILTLLPSIIIMMTSFTRIIVVFSFLKNALGAQQSIPNQILIGLALFLTIFIMQPVYSEINNNAFKPFMENTITQNEAMEAGSKPLREFMLKQTRQKDLELFVEASKLDKEEITRDNIPLTVVIPAFAISELKTAFQIGFLLFIPFLIIDMVVASVLMSMGMFMVPPVMVALPFKLLLFVMVDGWYLMVKSLIMSFGG